MRIPRRGPQGEDPKERIGGGEQYCRIVSCSIPTEQVIDSQTLILTFNINFYDPDLTTGVACAGGGGVTAGPIVFRRYHIPF